MHYAIISRPERFLIDFPSILTYDDFIKAKEWFSMIIDFHTHTFPAKVSRSVLDKLAGASHTAYFTDGSADGLRASMDRAHVDYSVNLPVMTYAGQVEKVNGSLMRDRESLLSEGIITFGGMHPDYEDYKNELKKLKEAGILGIKLHPAYQGIDFDDIRNLRIMDCASELGLIIITHAGIDIGIYDRNYCSVKMVLNVLKQVRPAKLVLAHMGGWGCWDEVERDLAGAPVWLDTAFSIGSITPNPTQTEMPLLPSNLSDEDFLRLVRKHGADKVLFATDSPWEDQADYIGRVERMPLTDDEKEAVLAGNAAALLGLA